MGKESIKEWIYVQLVYFGVHLRLTLYCKSTIPQFKKRHRSELRRSWEEGARRGKTKTGELSGLGG